MLKIALPVAALPLLSWGLSSTVIVAGNGPSTAPAIFFFLAMIWLTYNVFDQPADINKFKIFFRNGVLCTGLFIAVSAISYGLNSLPTIIPGALQIPIYLWCLLNIIGFTVRSLYLAVKNCRNFKLCATHAAKGVLAGGLTVVGSYFAWISSDVSGYQTGCLNPYLPLTDPQSKIVRSM